MKLIIYRSNGKNKTDPKFYEYNLYVDGQDFRLIGRGGSNSIFSKDKFLKSILKNQDEDLSNVLSFSIVVSDDLAHALLNNELSVVEVLQYHIRENSYI